jgi:hypothetical protein
VLQASGGKLDATQGKESHLPKEGGAMKSPPTPRKLTDCRWPIIPNGGFNHGVWRVLIMLSRVLSVSILAGLEVVCGQSAGRPCIAPPKNLCSLLRQPSIA